MAKRPCFSNVWRQEILTSTHSLLWSPSWQYIYRRLKKKAINQLKSKYWLLSQYPKLIQSTHWLAVLALCEVRVRLTHKSGTSPSRRISSLALPVPDSFLFWILGDTLCDCLQRKRSCTCPLPLCVATKVNSKILVYSVEVNDFKCNIA